jgi:hypothetical protein
MYMCIERPHEAAFSRTRETHTPMMMHMQRICLCCDALTRFGGTDPWAHWPNAPLVHAQAFDVQTTCVSGTIPYRSRTASTTLPWPLSGCMPWSLVRTHWQLHYSSGGASSWQQVRHQCVLSTASTCIAAQAMCSWMPAACVSFHEGATDGGVA